MILKIQEFSFNDEVLRGFSLTDIDDYKTNITDVKVTLQKNRAIVFNIIIDDVEIIKYLNDESLKVIKGKYYHHSFIAIVDSVNNRGYHIPFFTYDIVIDLIDFSKDETFFINSNKRCSLEVIPTENMIKYIDRRKQDDLLKFENLTFDEYNSRYRHLLELNSFIYNTPILIDKVIVKNEKMHNILFQSQNINKDTINQLSDHYPLLRNGHFTLNLDKYLDNFLKFRKSQNTLDLLLKVYFISDTFRGKEDYHLNDISGFIDLFDGVFYSLGGEVEKKEFICSECNKKKKTKKKVKSLSDKIDFVIDKLEPSLKLYEIDPEQKQSQILSNFRNRIRHPKSKLEEFNLNKLFTFSIGVLRLYVIKYILKVDVQDYDINRILSDFNIYPLVKHKYNGFNKDIIIYSTKLDNYGHNNLSENSVYYKTLISSPLFSKAKPSDFIYDSEAVEEIKKIYIDDNDKVRRALIFFGIITMDKSILQSSDKTYYLDIEYDELMDNLIQDKK